MFQFFSPWKRLMYDRSWSECTSGSSRWSCPLVVTLAARGFCLMPTFLLLFYRLPICRPSISMLTTLQSGQSNGSNVVIKKLSVSRFMCGRLYATMCDCACDQLCLVAIYNSVYFTAVNTKYYVVVSYSQKRPTVLRGLRVCLSTW